MAQKPKNQKIQPAKIFIREDVEIARENAGKIAEMYRERVMRIIRYLDSFPDITIKLHTLYDRDDMISFDISGLEDQPINGDEVIIPFTDKEEFTVVDCRFWSEKETLWTALIENKGILIDYLQEAEWFEKFDSILEDLQERAEEIYKFYANPYKYIKRTYNRLANAIEDELFYFIRNSEKDDWEVEKAVEKLESSYSIRKIKSGFKVIEEASSIKEALGNLEKRFKNYEDDSKDKIAYYNVKEYFTTNAIFRPLEVFPEDAI